MTANTEMQNFVDRYGLEDTKKALGKVLEAEIAAAKIYIDTTPDITDETREAYEQDIENMEDLIVALESW